MTSATGDGLLRPYVEFIFHTETTADGRRLGYISVGPNTGDVEVRELFRVPVPHQRPNYERDVHEEIPNGQA